MARYRGTAGNDFYSGTADADVIVGLGGNAGNYRISGGGGIDFLRRGYGRDPSRIS